MMGRYRSSRPRPCALLTYEYFNLSRSIFCLARPIGRRKFSDALDRSATVLYQKNDEAVGRCFGWAKKCAATKAAQVVHRCGNVSGRPSLAQVPDRNSATFAGAILGDESDLIPATLPDLTPDLDTALRHVELVTGDPMTAVWCEALPDPQPDRDAWQAAQRQQR